MKKHLQVRKTTSVSPRNGGNHWKEGFGNGIAAAFVGLGIILMLVVLGICIGAAN